MPGRPPTGAFCTSRRRYGFFIAPSQGFASESYPQVGGLPVPLIRVNARGRDPVLPGTGGCALPWLAEAAAGTGPIILMLHGYKFHPGHPVHCPHGHIFAPQDGNPCPKAVSWPARLGYGRGDPDEGLAVAFGWAARGRLRTVYDSAAEAGFALAKAVRTLRAAAPTRPIHAMGHSMGARVILQALPHLARGDLGRLVLLAGAEYRSAAETALDTPAGRSAEVINVTSRENDLFDFMFERLVPAPRPGDAALGAGLTPSDTRLTLPIDNPGLLDLLARRGIAIEPPHAVICHWSAYRRAGVFDLYETLFRRPEVLPLATLATALPQADTPRWSRLRARLGARTLARATWAAPLHTA